MSFFLLRLTPPRASFMADMSADERRVMGEHVGYWTDLARAGTAIVFGPVADPAGGWGVAIVEVGDAQAATALTQADPALRAGIGLRYDVLSMPTAIMRGSSMP